MAFSEAIATLQSLSQNVASVAAEPDDQDEPAGYREPALVRRLALQL